MLAGRCLFCCTGLSLQLHDYILTSPTPPILPHMLLLLAPLNSNRNLKWKELKGAVRKTNPIGNTGSTNKCSDVLVNMHTYTTLLSLVFFMSHLILTFTVSWTLHVHIFKYQMT